MKALHTLLSEMRSSKSIGADFSQTLDRIVVTVDNLINVFNGSVAQPYMAELRAKGESCLADFSNAKMRFKDAGGAVMLDPLSNFSRRQLASSSYHIAKVRSPGSLYYWNGS